MSAKARSLRERMSIDPDAPTPIAERRRGTPAASATTPGAERESAPHREEAGREEPDRERPVREETPAATAADDRDDSADEATEVPATDTPASATPAAPRARSSATRSSATRSSATRASSGRRARRPVRERVEWETALDDPAISADGNGYRSFYVSDEVFARFRAAVYWTARRPDVDGVPDNMSVGVEEYMDSVATDLERRFNGKSVFPPTPDQIRSHRKRQAKP